MFRIFRLFGVLSPNSNSNSRQFCPIYKLWPILFTTFYNDRHVYVCIYYTYTQKSYIGSIRPVGKVQNNKIRTQVRELGPRGLVWGLLSNEKYLNWRGFCTFYIFAGPTHPKITCFFFFLFFILHLPFVRFPR